MSTATNNLAVLMSIPLTQGYVALVDSDDFADLDQFKWFAVRHKRSIYACHWLRENGVRVREYMHVRLMVQKPGMEVDHKDGIGTNNFRSNLRHATSLQNSQNRRLDIRNKTGVSGVSWNKAVGMWRVHVGRIYIGRFLDFNQAVSARREAEQRIFGEFVRAA